jgi:hypothetical protein
VFDLRSDPGPTESFGLGLDRNPSEIVALRNVCIEAHSEGVGTGASSGHAPNGSGPSGRSASGLTSGSFEPADDGGQDLL